MALDIGREADLIDISYLKAAAEPVPTPLSRSHARRLREVYRSAGWPCFDMLEIELLVFQVGNKLGQVRRLRPVLTRFEDACRLT